VSKFDAIFDDFFEVILATPKRGGRGVGGWGGGRVPLAQKFSQGVQGV